MHNHKDSAAKTGFPFVKELSFRSIKAKKKKKNVRSLIKMNGRQ